MASFKQIARCFHFPVKDRALGLSFGSVARSTEKKPSQASALTATELRPAIAATATKSTRHLTTTITFSSLLERDHFPEDTIHAIKLGSPKHFHHLRDISHFDWKIS